MDQEIVKRVKGCDKCQLNQSAPAKAPSHPWEWPGLPWLRIHIDYTVPYTFSSTEATLLLVSTKYHDLWLGSTPEVLNSQTFRHFVHAQVKPDQSDWLRVQSELSAHVQKIGPGQRSQFLWLTKRSVASGDENGPYKGEMVLVVMNAYSKWLEVHHMKSIMLTTTIEKLRDVCYTWPTSNTH